MKELKPYFEMEDFGTDFEFEAMVLERNSIEAELLIKRGYKIKKPIWNGLVAS